MDTLFGAEKYYSELTFARLQTTGETFSGMEFEKCVFQKSNLLQCSFVRCKFIDCTFEETMMSAIDFKGSVFLETTFKDSKIMGIEWSKADKVRALQFFKCDMNMCGFSFMNLKEIVIKNSIAKDCNFMESDCSKADFEGTDFEKSIFQNTNLTEANFKHAFNYAINVKGNIVKSAKFSLPEAASLLGGLDIVLED